MKNNVIVMIIILIVSSCTYDNTFIDPGTENNYFSTNFDSIYRSISYDERRILDNTFIKIDSYVNDYGMIEYAIQKELFKYYDKNKLSIEEQNSFNKLYYLSLRDIHDLKLLKYDENLGYDKNIYVFLETVVNY